MVIPNTSYYIGSSANATWRVSFYDADMQFINYTNVTNNTFTTPVNAHYINFNGASTFYGSTYKNDICINISDPTRNGQYKPYSKHSYALDASLTLRGMMKYDATKGFYADGDVYKPDGTVERRFGIVDLGTLNWKASSSGAGRFYASNMPVYMYGYNADFLCERYEYKGYAAASDTYYSGGNKTFKTFLTSQGGAREIYVVDEDYTDASAFKTAMNGVYLVYELATPTTEEADPFEAIQITDGTEEYITDCLVPVGHESKYYANLRSKIEGLPTDFSAIICATEATNKASRNYAVGDYLIYNNTLYKVTTAIASDASLTVGTNITATTIMAEIKALQ
jgi:hypothetical protein